MCCSPFSVSSLCGVPSNSCSLTPSSPFKTDFTSIGGPRYLQIPLQEQWHIWTALNASETAPESWAPPQPCQPPRITAQPVFPLSGPSLQSLGAIRQLQLMGFLPTFTCLFWSPENTKSHCATLCLHEGSLCEALVPSNFSSFEVLSQPLVPGTWQALKKHLSESEAKSKRPLS